jgi:glutathione S-transferase
MPTCRCSSWWTGCTTPSPRPPRGRWAKTPAVEKLHDNIKRRQRVRDYLQSPRRIAFNEDGIFRRYAELDG